MDFSIKVGAYTVSALSAIVYDPCFRKFSKAYGRLNCSSKTVLLVCEDERKKKREGPKVSGENRSLSSRPHACRLAIPSCYTFTNAIDVYIVAPT